jgi:hypothetical protein
MKHFLGLCRYSKYKKAVELLKTSIKLSIINLELCKSYEEKIIDKDKDIVILSKMVDVYEDIIEEYITLRRNGEDIEFIEYITNYDEQICEVEEC